MEVGKTYLIIYDDKGHHPVKKTGVIQNIQGNLIQFNTGEILNSNNIIRAQLMESGKNEWKPKNK